MNSRIESSISEVAAEMFRPDDDRKRFAYQRRPVPYPFSRIEDFFQIELNAAAETGGFVPFEEQAIKLMIYVLEREEKKKLGVKRLGKCPGKREETSQRYLAEIGVVTKISSDIPTPSFLRYLEDNEAKLLAWAKAYKAHRAVVAEEIRRAQRQDRSFMCSLS